MSINLAYQYLFLSALIVLGILIGVVLVRSIIGPRITDRILCINMIGTLVICSVAILSQRQHEGYLVDISLIYAMISFLTVLILASVYIRKKDSSSDAGQTESAGIVPDDMTVFSAENESSAESVKVGVGSTESVTANESSAEAVDVTGTIAEATVEVTVESGKVPAESSEVTVESGKVPAESVEVPVASGEALGVTEGGKEDRNG